MGAHSFGHLSLVKQQIFTSITKCRGTGPQSDLDGKGPWRPFVELLLKAGPAQPTTLSGYVTNVFKNGDPTALTMAPLQCLTTVILKRSLLIFDQFPFLQLVPIAGLPLVLCLHFAYSPH